MIYIFKGTDNSCSQLFNVDNLTDSEKLKAVAIVEDLPLQNCPLNHYTQLMWNEDEKTLYWVYKELSSDDSPIYLIKPDEVITNDN